MERLKRYLIKGITDIDQNVVSLKMSYNLIHNEDKILSVMSEESQATAERGQGLTSE